MPGTCHGSGDMLIMSHTSPYWHSAILPPFITKKMKLKEVKLLHQGHTTDTADLIKFFCRILRFEATMDKAAVCCSSLCCCCKCPGGFTKDSDQALTLYFWWMSVTCRHFPKPRSPMSTDYSVMVGSRKPQPSHVACSHIRWLYYITILLVIHNNNPPILLLYTQ